MGMNGDMTRSGHAPCIGFGAVVSAFDFAVLPTMHATEDR